MKILIYGNKDFYTRPNPAFHLITAMMDDLMEAGHVIYHIGAEEEGLDKHIPDKYVDNPSFISHRVKMKPENKHNFVSRYLRGIKYAFRVRKHLKKILNEVDVVYLCSAPTVIFNLIATKIYRKNQKIIYNVQDMFPGSTIASGKMNNKLLQEIFRFLQRFVYKNSDVIVAISEDMKIKLIEEGVPEEKIRVIVNWYDDTSVKEIPREENLFVKKYSMDENKFWVQYAGTIGFVFDYKMVLSVAEILKDKKDIVFQIIGEGSQKNDFINEAKEKGLDNIVFLPLEPQEMVPHVYSACSVCFIPLKRRIIGNSVPSKAGLLMACRRAIVNSVDEDSDYYQMFEREKIGLSASNLDPQAVADAILKLYNDKALLEEYSNNAKEYSKYFTRSHSMSLYKKLFEEMASQK